MDFVAGRKCCIGPTTGGKEYFYREFALRPKQKLASNSKIKHCENLKIGTPQIIGAPLRILGKKMIGEARFSANGLIDEIFSYLGENRLFRSYFFFRFYFS